MSISGYQLARRTPNILVNGNSVLVTWVESQVGQGSTFSFTLPVIVERQVEAA